MYTQSHLLPTRTLCGTPWETTVQSKSSLSDHQGSSACPQDYVSHLPATNIRLPPGLGAAEDTQMDPVRSPPTRTASLRRQESGMAGPEPRRSRLKARAVLPTIRVRTTLPLSSMPLRAVSELPEFLSDAAESLHQPRCRSHAHRIYHSADTEQLCSVHTSLSVKVYRARALQTLI